MRPRRLIDILQQPEQKRAQILAEGLELLVEHIGELELSVGALRRAGLGRGAAILDTVVAEEAAKALIIVDTMRLGWSDGAAAGQHLRKFSDHVARGIYADLCAYNPGSFGEVKRIVEWLRRSDYLDGPTDADWSFRNEIEARREEAFYVDYVELDDGHEWVSPKNGYASTPWGSSKATELVQSMNRLGFFTPRSLEIISEVWSSFEPRDDTQWPDNASLSHQTVIAMGEAGLITDLATEGDLRTVYDDWCFPVGSLELKKRTVPSTELQAQREAAEEAFWRSEIGPIDY